MKTRILRVGDEMAAILPAAYVEKLHLDEGATLLVEEEAQSIRFTPCGADAPTVMESLDALCEQYDKTLKILAQ